MAAWGQGARGAAGYAEHGTSEAASMPPDTPPEQAPHEE